VFVSVGNVAVRERAGLLEENGGHQVSGHFPPPSAVKGDTYAMALTEHQDPDHHR
jgi:hypothetical protein